MSTSWSGGLPTAKMTMPSEVVPGGAPHVDIIVRDCQCSGEILRMSGPGCAGRHRIAIHADPAGEKACHVRLRGEFGRCLHALDPAVGYRDPADSVHPDRSSLGANEMQSPDLDVRSESVDKEWPVSARDRRHLPLVVRHPGNY